MTSFFLEILGISVSIALLFFLSLVEGAVNAASALTLRMNLEKEDHKAPRLLPLVIEDKNQLILPLQLGIQVAILAIAVLIARACIGTWQAWGAASAFAISLAVSIVFRQLLPRLLIQNEPEKKLILLLRYLNPLVAVLRVLAAPLSSILHVFRRMYQETETPARPAQEDSNDGEIQAYLEIGEDEGILEEEDTQLIQSVVEFGDTLVREVMTPRTRIAACSEGASITELRNVMVESRHSRIPIYRGDIDHVIGIAYIRQLLARYAPDKGNEPIGDLVHPAVFVPETKRVSALLKELQIRGDQMAIVIDEFGGVAGLVTIEDLVEEIVGEIHDEDQVQVDGIVEESPRNYIFRGSAELYRLEDLVGKKFASEGVTTVAGLIAFHLGRIPAPGEEFDLEGMRIQIMDADRKRIRRLRVRLAQPES